MYQIELTEHALADLNDFTLIEVGQILSLLSTWEDDPRPSGTQSVPLAEGADGMAFTYKMDFCTICYNIFEIAQVVKVVAVLKRFSWS
jgi:hypothetical protein